MRIQKFLHSCLLVEDGTSRILIDPGSWSFGPGRIDVGTLSKIDAIFITHKHADHCDPTAIKALVARDNCAVYCNEDVGRHLGEAGITPKVIGDAESTSVGSLTVLSLPAPHGALPWSDAANTCFLINNRLLAPGDSFHPEVGSVEILALPILSPWGSSTKALAFATRLKPARVIPVHDMIVADAFRERLIENVGLALTHAGMSYHPLKPGEILDIS